jgi:hypothetical protein
MSATPSTVPSAPKSGPLAFLTPEQLAKAAERKAAKDAKRAAAAANGTAQADQSAAETFLKREWLPVRLSPDIGEHAASSERKGVRIVTWNVSSGLDDSSLLATLSAADDCRFLLKR